MLRRYLSAVIAAGFVLFLVFLYYERVLGQSYGNIWSSHQTTSQGSSYITKGPYAEDKVVVLAQTTSENASCQEEELPEYVVAHRDLISPHPLADCLTAGRMPSIMLKIRLIFCTFHTTKAAKP